MPRDYDYYGRDGGNIRDLILMGGDIEARRAGRPSVFAEALPALGQAAGQYLQQRQERKTAEERQQALHTAMDEFDPADKRSFMRLAGILGPDKAVEFAKARIGLETLSDKADEENLAKAKDVGNYLAKADPSYITPRWQTIVPKIAPVLSQMGLQEQDYAEFTPELQQAIGQMVGYERPRQAEKLVRTVGPEGQPLERLVTEEELRAGVPGYEKPQAPERSLAEKIAEATALAEARAKVGQKYAGEKESAETKKKAQQFKTAVPVINAVSELSQRINTLQGVVARAAGTAERAKAEINLNDDVSEYQALVMGFTPLVARALGHTGVLTEQDVVSVRGLFPRPEDSKSVRDRKVKRLQSIMQQMPGIEAGAFQSLTSGTDEEPPDG